MSAFFNDWLTRRMMARQGGGGLPADYQELEYISMDRAQGITLSSSIALTAPGFYVKYRKTSNADDLGYHIISHSNNNLWFVARSRDDGLINITGTQTNGIGGSGINTIYEVSMGTDGTTDAYLDGVYVKTLTAGNQKNAGVLGLFYYPGQASNIRWKFGGDVFAVKIYNSGSLLYDMIPCQRIADSVAGMYDLKGLAFYPDNLSTGFIAGPVKST